MKLYICNYFNMVLWEYVEEKILAENEQQVIEFIDKKVSKSCRLKPYRSRGEPEEDSLEIEELIDDIKFPCELEALDTYFRRK